MMIMNRIALLALCLGLGPVITGLPSALAWDGTHFKKPPEKELKAKLTAEQFDVTQHEGTEPPYHNEYWDNHRDGIYVDRVSGEPLFSSLEKYDSGTGWPSFFRPLKPENIVKRSDRSLFDARTEIRSKFGDSHLGHVFDDGPKPTGLRYCMNSAALRFIPVADLEKEGYGEFRSLFPGKGAAGATPNKTVAAPKELR